MPLLVLVCDCIAVLLLRYMSISGAVCNYPNHSYGTELYYDFTCQKRQLKQSICRMNALKRTCWDLYGRVSKKVCEGTTSIMNE